MLSTHSNFNASGSVKLSVQHFLKRRPKTTAKINLSEEKIPLIPPMKADNWSEFRLVCGEFSIIVKASSELEAAMKMVFVLLEVDVLDLTELQRH